MTTDQAATIACLPTLLDALAHIDRAALRWELATLRRESEWARAQLPVQPGDKVTITSAIPTDNGWAPHHDALAMGATGTAVAVALSSRGHWYADVALDRCWSESSWTGLRYWCGAANETPDGYEAPSGFGNGRHIFALRLDWLTKHEPGDD